MNISVRMLIRVMFAASFAMNMSMARAVNSDPATPLAPKSYSECANIGERYGPVLRGLEESRKGMPMRGKQVQTGPCCLEYFPKEAVKLGSCQTFESIRDATEAWFCAVNRKNAAIAKCRDLVSSFMKRTKYEAAFATTMKKLDSSRTSNDVLWAAVEWDRARHQYFDTKLASPPDELEEFRQAVFNEIANPVKERGRDTMLWMLGRELAKRYPNVAVNGAMVLQAIGRAAQRIAPLLTIIDAMRPSTTATDDEELALLDLAVRRKISKKLALFLVLEPQPVFIPPERGPTLKGMR
jgi:hypothetical protein